MRQGGQRPHAEGAGDKYDAGGAGAEGAAAGAVMGDCVRVATVVAAMTTLYALLDVPEDATLEQIRAAYRRAWDEGLTARKIAALLPNWAKNAVVGKARRLGLAPRPSPIRR